MSPKLQIVLFIIFAALIFVFIRVFSANPKSAETADNEAVVGQMILPTQAPDTEQAVKSYTNRAATFSFEYPADWIASTSAEITPDASAGALLESVTFVSPDGADGVTAQVNTNAKALKTEALFDCLQTKKCETGTSGSTEYVKSVDDGGITSVGTVKENQVYILKILGPTDDILMSVKFP
jgi:hypothetical protein